MSSGQIEAFVRLLFETCTSPAPLERIRVTFDGDSEWLRQCRAVIEKLPCVEISGEANIVVNDSGAVGEWRFALNGQAIGPDLTEFFWHANKGPQPVELSLHSPEGVEGLVRVPPSEGFYWRQHHAAAIEAAPALLAIAILRRAGAQLRPAGPPDPVRNRAARPGRVALNWFRLKKLARSLYLRLPFEKSPGRWQVALHEEAQNTVPDSGWTWLTGFEGHQAADPFLVSNQGKHWLFFEDMVPPSGRGRLAAMPAFEPATEPELILDLPYHLSYPCVFEHGGQWWMIPESAANRTVDLYRARRFPYEWSHARTLIEGPQLVDTTPLFHEGRWYFFTTALLPGRAMVALLFHSEELDGAWQLHPASPLTGDASAARSAGAIRQWKGRLVRPVQDCLTRYGYSMTLNEIVELTPAAFVERTIERILPSWSEGLTATHTFSPAGSALALDGRR